MNAQFTQEPKGQDVGILQAEEALSLTVRSWGDFDVCEERWTESECLEVGRQ